MRLTTRPYGLNLSGGTALIAYQLPIVQAVVAEHGLPAYAAGVSSGSLLAAAVGMGEAGLAIFDKLIGTVDGTKWFQALSIGKSGLFSLAPLEKQIRKAKLAERLVIPVYVGVTDMATGRFRLVLLNDLSYDDRVAALIASCTQPGIHETTQFQSAWCADGGLRHVLPPRPPGFVECDVIGVCSSPVEEQWRLPNHTQDEVSDAFESVQAAFAMLMTNTILRDIEVLSDDVAETRSNAWIYAPKTWSRVGKPFKASKEDMAFRRKSGAEDAMRIPRLQFLNRG